MNILNINDQPDGSAIVEVEMSDEEKTFVLSLVF